MSLDRKFWDETAKKIEGCEYRHIYICPLPNGHSGPHQPLEFMETYLMYMWSLERDLRVAHERIEELERLRSAKEKDNG